MIVLSIDTCDARGSVAVLRDGDILGFTTHQSADDYSIWLLPAVEAALRQAGVSLENVDGYAVAAGPGSFTGVRVGLTTVKAWAEVHGKPIVPVSRLEVIATLAREEARLVAAFASANRGEVFGAVYRRNGTGLERLGDEALSTPARFIATAVGLAGAEGILWASVDPECIMAEEGWKARERLGEKMVRVPPFLAETIARIGATRLAEGRGTDALALDANYLRRSDAEMLWKDTNARGS